MLSSLILSLTMATSPVADINELSIDQAAQKRGGIRINDSAPEILKAAQKRGGIRINNSAPEILKSAQKRGGIRI